MNNLQKRKSPRKTGYDYTLGGAYYITICTNKKENILSEIIPDKSHGMPTVKLTSIGYKISEAIKGINLKFKDFQVDEYIIMPNHIHFIIYHYKDGQTSISDVIRNFKSYTTHIYGQKLWQRSFYDHIIRNENDYKHISKYIYENPARWIYDDTH